MLPAPPPAPGELPSSRALLRSTALAAATALLLLVVVVLPAEYGVDPTGVGRLLGLTPMGEIKVALAREADADLAGPAVLTAAPAPASPPVATPLAPGAPDTTSDVTRVTLRPNEGKEVKLAMREGARVTYAWATDYGVVNYDTHGDRTGAPRGFYHGYGKGSGVWSDEGELVAAFDGLHGWFWRNRTRDTVTVTLRTRGAYASLKRLD